MIFAVVDSMMVREFTPTGKWNFFGGVFVMDDFDVRDVGAVTERLSYDTARVDCSNRMFQITNWMLMDENAPAVIWCFPSRRWRNMRDGEDITGLPSRETPLLYLGNPIRVSKDENGIMVMQQGGEFIIKSGPELGY